MRPKLRLPVKSEASESVDTSPQFEIDQLVNLIVVYNGGTKLEARHLISSVIHREHCHPLSDILEWCIHIKEIERAQQLIDKVRQGLAVVQKNSEGKWVAIKSDEEGEQSSTEEKV